MESIYVDYHALLVQHTIHRYDLTRPDAEDTVSEVFERLYKKSSSDEFEHRGDASVRAWLFKSVANAVIDIKRQETRLRERFTFVSLDKAISNNDCTRALGDIIPDNLEVDYADKHQREFVIELAKDYLNPQEQKLLRHRLLNEPLGMQKSQTWVNTNWHRLTKRLLSIIESIELEYSDVSYKHTGNLTVDL